MCENMLSTGGQACAGNVGVKQMQWASDLTLPISAAVE